MTEMNNIKKTDKLPRAIADEFNGVVLYVVKELNITGIHQRGVAKLLKCSISTVQNALKTSDQRIEFLEAKIVTQSGLQPVQIITEKDLPELLETIIFSRAKIETRRNASSLSKQLAAAGFRLMAFMGVDPEGLAEQAIAHAQQMELIKAKTQLAKAEQSLLEKRQIISHLPEPLQQKILGYREINRIEYRDRIIKDEEVLNDGNGMSKGELCSRFDFYTAKGKPDYKRLNQWLSDMGYKEGHPCWEEQTYLGTHKKFSRDYLEELDAAWDKNRGNGKQLYIGEKLDLFKVPSKAVTPKSIDLYSPYPGDRNT